MRFQVKGPRGKEPITLGVALRFGLSFSKLRGLGSDRAGGWKAKYCSTEKLGKNREKGVEKLHNLTPKNLKNVRS